MDVGNEGYVLTRGFSAFAIGPKASGSRNKRGRAPMWAAPNRASYWWGHPYELGKFYASKRIQGQDEYYKYVDSINTDLKKLAGEYFLKNNEENAVYADAHGYRMFHGYTVKLLEESNRRHFNEGWFQKFNEGFFSLSNNMKEFDIYPSMSMWQSLLVSDKKLYNYKPRDFVPDVKRWDGIRTGAQNLYYRPTELGVEALNEVISEGEYFHRKALLSERIHRIKFPQEYKDEKSKRKKINDWPLPSLLNAKRYRRVKLSPEGIPVVEKPPGKLYTDEQFKFFQADLPIVAPSDEDIHDMLIRHKIYIFPLVDIKNITSFKD